MYLLGRKKDSRKGRKRWERGAKENLFELVSTHAGEKFVRTLGGVNKQHSVLKAQFSGFACEAWVDRPVNQPW